MTCKSEHFVSNLTDVHVHSLHSLPQMSFVLCKTTYLIHFQIHFRVYLIATEIDNLLQFFTHSTTKSFIPAVINSFICICVRMVASPHHSHPSHRPHLLYFKQFEFEQLLGIIFRQLLQQLSTCSVCCLLPVQLLLC